ncbi:hypothetical protein NBE98_04945 [Clostridium swellfunianum]|uniref:hypothetical protein n=1 Tax=Clostridium swellfunianum TaxID=1367462 RepID=UPI00202E7BB7|nr:hypothetical protein [Clostridium swellfunianum]MCM0647723.1 hypothetical protein [Clostridium swellfunianum]
MKRLIPKVTPKYLLLIAGIVWLIAGGNILKIGFTEFILNWHGNIIYLLEVLLVFMIFMGLIFYPLVKNIIFVYRRLRKKRFHFINSLIKKAI